MEASALLAKMGKKTAKYPTKATAIAAFVHQIDIQYPQATKYAGNLPNPAFVYAYGPPVVCGNNLLRLPKTTARSIAPIEEKSQPIKLIPPKAAKEAGNKNTPEPIMFPMTKALLDQKPIFLLDILHGVIWQQV